MTALASSLLVLAAFGLVPSGEKNLLAHGDFEEGATGEARGWQNDWPSTLVKRAPEHAWSDAEPHGGKHCARLTTHEAKGYSSFRQEVAAVAGAKSVHVEGWLRREGDALPSLILILYDPAKPDASAMRTAPMPPGTPPSTWVKVAIDASVPASAKQWLVRCGTSGAGTVAFDDVVLTTSDADVEVTTLIAAHGDYRVERTGGSSDPWIELPFPFPFEGQTPLAIDVTTKPADRVEKIELVRDRENRALRVHLKALDREAPTDVRFDGLVLVRGLERGDARTVALAPRDKLPKEVALYFEKTPGIDPDHPGIREVAKGVRTTSMAEAIEGTLAWMRANFTYEGGGDQGGKASFERKNAVCTGHANLATSILQAAGVPCRVLGCLIGERLQEHYVVEVWAPKEGWRRVESTSKVFPIDDAEHLILHVAYPDFERNGGNVPLRLRADGCAATYRMGDDHCWQGMTPGGTVGLDPAEAARVEALARASFAAWEKAPIAGARVVLGSAERPGKPSKTAKDAKPFSAAAQDLLDRAARFPAP